MPLIETDYGAICPLGRIRRYDNIAGRDMPFFDRGPTPTQLGDPLSECTGCSFSLLSGDTRDEAFEDGWDWSKVCQAPVDLTLEELGKIREAYMQSGKYDGGKPTFWKFVAENRQGTSTT